MKHVMPLLPYATDAFKETLSKESFDFHYGKHLQAYVDNLNRLISGTQFENSTLEEIISASDGAIFNNAAQIWNHTLFFENLIPEKKEMPAGFRDMVIRDFGSVDLFREALFGKAASLFGSGWAWLSADPEGKLVITAESNAGNPLRNGLRPLLTLDVWEHAYYIDYRNRRADYLAAIWEHIDWTKVANRY